MHKNTLFAEKHTVSIFPNVVFYIEKSENESQ